MKINIELSMGELKEMLGSLLPLIWSENRIKPLSNIPNLSPVEVPSKKVLNDFKKILKKEIKRLPKTTIDSTIRPIPHNEFVQMGKKILDKNHKHRPGRPKKVIR